VIPKASVKKRIKENSQLFDFEISDEDMKIMDDMNENYHCTWDPSNVF